jgi:isoleucyl-tRNA synthetase
VMGPIIPFLSEHLWRTLVADPCEDAPESVFLAGWPQVREELVNESLLAEIAAARRVVQLGRRARASANFKLRQPLRRVYVRGAPLAAAHVDEIAEELRVKEVEFDQGPVVRARLLPNLRVLGPRLGRKLPEVRAALERGDFEQLDEDRLLVAGEELGPDDVIRGERITLPGWSMAEDGGVSLAFDTELDEELRREGRVYDLVHTLNAMRKQAGLELTDRIVVTLPAPDADLLSYVEWIEAEVLAREVVVGEVSQPAIAKA